MYIKKYVLRKQVIALILCTLIICTDALSAGSKPTNTHVPVTTVFTGNQCKCSQNQLKIIQLTNQKQLDTFLRQSTQTILGASNNDLIPIDFSNDTIVAIWMGKKPTAGYGLGLEEKSAELKDHTAIVQVNLKEPDPDAMLAQMITSPCLLIKLPKGDYRKIEIVSQHNDLLTTLSINN